MEEPYDCPMPQKAIDIPGLYSDISTCIRDKEGQVINEINVKQERYNYEVYFKLRFYKENNIPIKFRLIEPKNFYETKGKIIEFNSIGLILEYNNLKFIHPFWEIDIHTIYPLEYNPIVEFIRREIPQEIRDRVFKRDNYTCQLKFDGCKINYECIDHIIPVSKGGGDNIENLQTSCNHCNQKKSNKVFY